jgi:hypothetical protein
VATQAQVATQPQWWQDGLNQQVVHINIHFFSGN